MWNFAVGPGPHIGLTKSLDVYIENFIPRRYADLPVIIVLCLGGDFHEDVRTDVEGYMKRNTVDWRAAGLQQRFKLEG